MDHNNPLLKYTASFAIDNLKKANSIDLSDLTGFSLHEEPLLVFNFDSDIEKLAKFPGFSSGDPTSFKSKEYLLDYKHETEHFCSLHSCALGQMFNFFGRMKRETIRKLIMKTGKRITKILLIEDEEFTDNVQMVNYLMAISAEYIFLKNDRNINLSEIIPLINDFNSLFNERFGTNAHELQCFADLEEEYLYSDIGCVLKIKENPGNHNDLIYYDYCADGMYVSTSTLLEAKAVFVEFFNLYVTQFYPSKIPGTEMIIETREDKEWHDNLKHSSSYSKIFALLKDMFKPDFGLSENVFEFIFKSIALIDLSLCSMFHPDLLGQEKSYTELFPQTRFTSMLSLFLAKDIVFWDIVELFENLGGDDPIHAERLLHETHLKKYDAICDELSYFRYSEVLNTLQTNKNFPDATLSTLCELATTLCCKDKLTRTLIFSPNLSLPRVQIYDDQTYMVFPKQDPDVMNCLKKCQKDTNGIFQETIMNSLENKFMESIMFSNSLRNFRFLLDKSFKGGDIECKFVDFLDRSNLQDFFDADYIHN